MAWFGRGETLGRLPVKVRWDQVLTAYGGQQPLEVRRTGTGQRDSTDIPGGNRYVEQ
jgi:hypothetical protein